MSEPVGIVIAVYKGWCDAVWESRVHSLRLVGRHAHREQAFAVGDEVTFDAERGVVLELLPRRTRLARRRPRAPHKEQVIAANIDRVAIVTSVREPPFRAGLVDRFLLAADAGGLEAILVVNKIDLVDGALDEEITSFERVVDVFGVSATTGAGLAALRARLEGSRTVLAGHSGVGKSSLINALEPKLRLETGEVTAKYKRGRHTTTRAVWLELDGGAIVVDTPGLRELAAAEVDPGRVDVAYPDVAELAEDCRFRDCAHKAEPGCAVRDAVEKGDLSAARLAGYQRLVRELAEANQPR